MRHSSSTLDATCATTSSRCHGRESELVGALDTETATYQRAFLEGDFDTAAIFAGKAVDLIDDVVQAAELVQRIGAAADARRPPSISATQ